jgi:hypothetical protein
VGGKVAEDFFDRGLCLPSGTAMRNGDLDRIIETVKNVSRKGAKPLRKALKNISNRFARSPSDIFLFYVIAVKSLRLGGLA